MATTWRMLLARSGEEPPGALRKSCGVRLNSVFTKVAVQFRVEFDELAREIEHRGEAGEAREEALRSMLRRYLPSRVEVGTGFVIDATGAESKQVDIVLYDRSVGTVFDGGGIQYFPCETVIVVGEVRTRIESTDHLETALANIASVKSLDRSNGGRNLPITGPGYSMSPPFTFDPANQHRDQIFGFIFTGSSLTEETLVETLRQWNASHPRRVWLNVYCDFNRSLVSYEGEGEGEEHLTTSAMDARSLYVAAPEERETLLLLFVALVATFVNEAHVARPDLFAYAGIEQTMHLDYPLT